MVRQAALWQHSAMLGRLKAPNPWIFAIAALAVWFAVAWPVLQAFAAGAEIREAAVPGLWLVPFASFGAAAAAALVLKLRPGAQWALLALQLASVVAMAILVNWAMMSIFLVVTAWQAAMTTEPFRALSWVVFQSLALVATLALVPNPDLCWIHWMAFGLQLVVLFTANALRREAETARALARAQAVIASNARDSERLRISRELHDALGHELTALGLQLEIASHVTEPGRALDSVIQARGLSRDLLAKVRDVVSTLREAERCDLEQALKALAQSIPAPRIHVEFCTGIRVGPEQAHALMRCAQEAVTNAVRHSQASNLWLRVTSDGDGIRLVARNDGSARPAAASSGSGLLGMRERVETLGGRLAVGTGAGFGFTVDAWLPSRAPQAG
jgi:signal transduction histidine kinase